ncbi:GTP-binding protein GEM-like [Pecten maximus]|uniref:GTP-binding protein GEM-like n=1 Tax=Pecten maximus TaxID=6579 RepID=UPI00145918EF|nr:GTP-binding protein GEM-like [Pecten maximus]
MPDKTFVLRPWLISDGEDNKSISVLLDGEESTLEFIKLTSCSGWDYKDNVDAYVVVYATDDRQTFDRAVDLLYCLRKDEKKENATILVANKCDLERSRTVSIEEAKAVAKTYEAKFVETSTVVNHNIDELLVGILSQIRLKLKQQDKPRTRTEVAQGCINKSKSLFNKIFRKEDMSKSCQNLYVL